MAWWVAGAALGAATSLFGGMQQRSAAQSANREREKQPSSSSSVRKRNTKLAGDNS